MYSAGRHSPWQGKIPEADGSKRASPDPWLRRWRSRVSAGLEPEGGHLVLLVTDLQREVMQGEAKDGPRRRVAGSAVRYWYVAVPPHEHRRCVDEVIRQLRRRAEAVLFLVEGCSAALSVLEIFFFLYIFLAGYSVSATSLRMSPIYDFLGMSRFEPRVLP
jgi:hypothetical protein